MTADLRGWWIPKHFSVSPAGFYSHFVDVGPYVSSDQLICFQCSSRLHPHRYYLNKNKELFVIIAVDHLISL
jgi:hypothetical protein